MLGDGGTSFIHLDLDVLVFFLTVEATFFFFPFQYEQI